jgi:hypothetical protein
MATSLIRIVGISTALALVLAAVGLLDVHRQARAAGAAPIFFDGFENADSLKDLFPANGSRWSGLQREPRGNLVALSTEKVLAGAQALKMYAQRYNGSEASKADIFKSGLPFAAGDEVWTEIWVYVVGGGSPESLFLWDLEAPDTCTSAIACPRPGTGRICNSPGRRLYLIGDSSSWLKSDLGKWCIPQDFIQTPGQEIPLPLDQWVRLRVYMQLSAESDGVMKVWQNDALIINAQGITLPRQDSIYSRLQAGITANGNTRYSQAVYLDNVSVWDQNPAW